MFRFVFVLASIVSLCAVVCGAADVAERLAKIEDRFAVIDLFSQCYAHAVDTKDFRLWRTCFTHDATVDYTANFGGMRGTVEEGARWLEAVLVFFDGYQHSMSNFDVRFNGDQVGSSQCMRAHWAAMGLLAFAGAWALVRCALCAPATCPAGDTSCQEPLAPDFFRSYGTAYVQAEMLHDEVRTTAFRDAILGNRGLFEGKTVLDVGCGTGILSFFAAQAGAKKVFAVEGSDMAHVARQIAKDNGLDDVVEVVHGMLEEVELPVQTVDIIVSEWIGTFLIHESMLDSVLFARDKWLAPDGLLVPDRSTLYVAGMDDQFADLGAWKDFYGLDFSALAAKWRGVAAQQCAIGHSIATQPVVVLDLDLYKTKVPDQEFLFSFRSELMGDKAADVHAFSSWFTAGFFNITERSRNGNVSELDSHPDKPCTHWQQTFMFLPEPITMKVGDSLSSSIQVKRVEGSPRDLSIHLEIDSLVSEDFVIVGAEY